MQGVRTNIICDSCKQRKKACDLKKPCCGRCKQLGVECRYGARTFVFFNELNHGRRTASQVLQLPVEQNSTSAFTVEQMLQIVPDHSAFHRADTDLQVSEAFWSILMPRSQTHTDLDILGTEKMPWLMTARQMDQEPCLQHALLATAYVGLGWRRDDVHLVRRALKEYALALRKVNEALRDPLQARSHSTLACCRVLGLFEMFKRLPGLEPSEAQSTTWRRHAEGTYELVRMRGKYLHLEGAGASMYDSVRMTAVIQGIFRRQPNTCTRLRWGIVMHGLRDALFELACEIPELMQTVDKIRTDARRPDIEQSELESSAVAVSQSLIHTAQKFAEWESSTIQACRNNNTHDWKTKSGSITSLKDICESNGSGFLFLVTQYWAICMHTYSTARMLERSVEVLRLPSWMSPEQYAANIAEVAPRFFGEDMGLWGAQSAMFPLGSSLAYYTNTGRPEAAQSILDATGRSPEGLMVRDFLSGIGVAQKQRQSEH